MAKFGKCCICGAFGPLTFEHVPPRAAYNDRGLLAADLQQLMMTGTMGDPRTARRRKNPRGAGKETLCAKCNNDTGALYGNAYVGWAEQGMHFRYAAPGGSSLQLPFHIFPGRIGKQILCMFASACGPGLFESNNDLRRYVLNRDLRGIPPKFRVYCYLMDLRSQAVRQAGLTALLCMGEGHHVFSEIAFPPFGYILAVESQPADRDLLDITFFTRFGYQDFRSEYMYLPVRAVNSYFPGDFRTEEEWAESLEAAYGPGS